MNNGYQQIRNLNEEKVFQELLDNYYEYWIMEKNCSIYMINYHRKIHQLKYFSRSNNNVEAFHSILFKKLNNRHSPQIEVFIDKLVQIEFEKANSWGSFQYQDKKLKINNVEKDKQKGQCYILYLKKLIQSYYKLRSAQGLNVEEIQKFCKEFSDNDIERLPLIFDEYIQNTSNSDQNLVLNIESPNEINAQDQYSDKLRKSIKKLKFNLQFSDEEEEEEQNLEGSDDDFSNEKEEDKKSDFPNEDQRSGYSLSFQQVNPKSFVNIEEKDKVLYPKDFPKLVNQKSNYFDTEDIQDNCWKFLVQDNYFYIYIPKMETKKVQFHHGYLVIGAYNYLLYNHHHPQYTDNNQKRSLFYKKAREDLINCTAPLPDHLNLTTNEKVAYIFKKIYDIYNSEYVSMPDITREFISGFYKLQNIEEIDFKPELPNLGFVNYQLLEEFWSSESSQSTDQPEEMTQTSINFYNDETTNSIDISSLQETSSELDLELQLSPRLNLKKKEIQNSEYQNNQCEFYDTPLIKFNQRRGKTSLNLIS
ncbi:hypothetical protein ABPG72_020022 [Tetrahymena utriculariae]